MYGCTFTLSPQGRPSPLALLLLVLKLDLIACVGQETGQNRDVSGMCINKKILEVWEEPVAVTSFPFGH